MPPSGFSKKAVAGALQFVGACYTDLLEEVQNGKHPSLEAAIEFELGQIARALEALHVTPSGGLEER